MCRPRVFATMSVFARPVFGTCLRTPASLRDERVFTLPAFRKYPRAPTCLRQPVFGTCLRAPTCFRDVAGVRQACLRDVSLMPAHVSSRRRVSSPDLSSGSVFVRPRVFATTHAFARPVFWTCSPSHVSSRRRVFARLVFAHSHVSSRRHVLRPTCLRQLSSRTHMASLLEVPWQGQCAREVSSDAHASSHPEVSSPGKRLQTPTCLRCLRLACVC